MGCFLILFAILIPRIVMIFIFFFSSWFSQAYNTVIWPVLGFIFLPYTTLAYMAAMLQNHHQLSGGWLALFIIAIIVDVSSHGGSTRYRRY